MRYLGTDWDISLLTDTPELYDGLALAPEHIEGVEEVVDFVFATVERVQAATKINFRSTIESIYSEYARVHLDFFKGELGVVGWAGHWFVVDLMREAGYDEKTGTWKGNYRSVVADRQGLTTKEKSNLYRGLASVMASAHEADVLLRGMPNGTVEGGRIGVLGVYTIGVALDEMRRFDPNFQVVRPGIDGYNARYLRGDNVWGTDIAGRILKTLRAIRS
jgi:hypothetical protein